MKIRIEIDEDLIEDEILIRSKMLNEQILNIESAVREVIKSGRQMEFIKGDTTYYLPFEDILFFETEGNLVYAHTKADTYSVKYRLYELEENLPGFFMRISKSTILNVKKVYAVTRSLSASGMIEFQGSHKQAYVSRYYYKPLKDRLEEKR